MMPSRPRDDVLRASPHPVDRTADGRIHAKPFPSREPLFIGHRRRPHEAVARQLEPRTAAAVRGTHRYLTAAILSSIPGGQDFASSEAR